MHSISMVIGSLGYACQTSIHCIALYSITVEGIVVRSLVNHACDIEIIIKRI
jgi:hypothetical protein